MPPARLAWAATGVAVLAVILGATLSGLGGPAVVESGQTVPPSWSGSATLDRQGIYDSDADGLPDAVENLVYGTDPAKADSGGSGLPDGWLVRYGFDPLDPTAADRPAARPPPAALPAAYRGAWPAAFVATLRDIYAHGRPAEWNESAQGPFASGLDPTAWDSNGDGLPDGWLLHHGLDPLDRDIGAARLAGPGGLTVREAFEHATDPHLLDSDRDGLPDREELAGPANPTERGPRRFP
ncbi:MAG TPA: hypothetical protein VHI93_05225, partial [Candidatus Thermoplasmatota archaeon]|nr:hypothetical protein [Candidatus Thermoplasmatota archaeon]